MPKREAFIVKQQNGELSRYELAALKAIDGCSERDARLLWDGVEAGTLTLGRAQAIANRSRSRTMNRVPVADGIADARRGRRAKRLDAVDLSVDSARWDQVRKLTRDIVIESAPDLDHSKRAELSNELLVEVGILVSAWQVKLSAARAARADIPRVELLSACGVLNIDPPRIGDDAERFVRKARAAQKRLAKQYHPDANGGDVALVPLYREVITAFECVQRWAALHLKAA